MPHIAIIGRTNFDSEAFDAFLKRIGSEWYRTSCASEAEELVEASGRICYMSFGARQSPKKNDEYIAHLIRMGHESVLEHVNWTFLIENVSRAFTHQLVRHRVGFAFSQLSQQYHDETDAEFIEPVHLERFPAAKDAWQQAMQTARVAYRQIRDIVTAEEEKLGLEDQCRETLRAVRSAARSVLPNATETKIIVTANARAIRHFLTVRGSIPGDTEMRYVAAELLKLLTSEAPAIFQDFSIRQLKDGSPIVVRDGQVT